LPAEALQSKQCKIYWVSHTRHCCHESVSGLVSVFLQIFLKDNGTFKLHCCRTASCDPFFEVTIH